MSVTQWVRGRVFNVLHGRNLVYNTCWEDPRLDRVALELGPDDSVMVITSAGCNALDYALVGPREVHAVDMNPRQNALLELKLSGIRNLDFETFFAMFGKGRVDGVRAIYRDKLRDSLSEWSQDYWDRFIKFFEPTRQRPFYFRGTSGTFAKMVNVYLDRVVKLRPHIENMLSAESVFEQREIYDKYVRSQLWTRPLRFAMRRDTTWSLVGVPRAQRDHLERAYPGGIGDFVEECFESVFGTLPLKDNYFWRVYLTSEYTKECCPEYLKEENFQRLKDGAADVIQIHTNSVQEFLEGHDGKISRFVLLDHMDWLCDKFYAALEAEWQAIVDNASEESRVIWRSGGVETDFVNSVKVEIGGTQREVGSLLTYHRELAEQLHERDRVHTYGSFHIAELQS